MTERRRSDTVGHSPKVGDNSDDGFTILIDMVLPRGTALADRRPGTAVVRRLRGHGLRDKDPVIRPGHVGALPAVGMLSPRAQPDARPGSDQPLVLVRGPALQSQLVPEHRIAPFQMGSWRDRAEQRTEWRPFGLAAPARLSSPFDCTSPSTRSSLHLARMMRRSSPETPCGNQGSASSAIVST